MKNATLRVGVFFCACARHGALRANSALHYILPHRREERIYPRAIRLKSPKYPIRNKNASLADWNYPIERLFYMWIQEPALDQGLFNASSSC
jgi:hypothetical protein